MPILILIQMLSLCICAGVIAHDKQKITHLEKAHHDIRNLRIKDQFTIGELQAEVDGLRKEKQHNRMYELEISAYTISKRETDKDPHVTAFMERPVPGKTCAVSRDLIKKLKDKRIYIEGVGVRKVNDTMNKRYTKSIDLVVNNKRQALDFGRVNRKVVILD